MLKQLHNKYYLLRHGNSLANKKNIIVSNPVIGIKEYGLSTEGRNSISKNCKNIPYKKYIILSSPFKRTKETAIIISEELKIPDIEYNDNLRERFFGDFDMKDSKNYERIWEEDLTNTNHKKWNNESVHEVAIRLMSLIEDLEITYNDRDIILVSHGDSLQILECLLKKIDPKLHRSLKPLKQGEFRDLSFLSIPNGHNI